MCYSSLGTQVPHVLTRYHRVLPATHIYPQVEQTIPAFNPQLQSIAPLWLVLISHLTEDRSLS